MPATVDYFLTDADCAAFHGRLEMEAPNGVFNKFTGVLHMGQSSGGAGAGAGAGARAGSGASKSIEADQALLRG